MIINNFWAVCEINSYTPFHNPLTPVAYLSKDLFKLLRFNIPNLCNLVVKNKKYEFYALPIFDFQENLDEIIFPDVYLKKHVAKIPLNIYHDLLGYEDNHVLSIRTDCF